MVVLVGLACARFAPAETEMPHPNWDRGMALEAVESADTQAPLASLFQLARQGDSRSVLESLSALQRDQALAAPVIDYILFSFAAGLSDLDAGSVDSSVLNALSSYTPRALVAHDDDPGLGVPLFNVRAATAGIHHAWERQNGTELAQRLQSDQPALWIERYLESGFAARRGFIDALDTAPAADLQRLGWMVAAQLEQRPELMIVAATAGLRTADIELVWQSIQSGNSPDLPTVLREVPEEFGPEVCSELLNRSLNLDSIAGKALAIAQLGPPALKDPDSREKLFELLESRELGSGAALVLGASADPEIQKRLAKLAGDGEGLAGKRAALAVRLQESDAGSIQ